MITLTLNPNTNPEERIFDKPLIIIGAEGLPTVDISLPNESLQAVHVKLFLDGDRWAVINAANDPFVTLNALPFSRRKLFPGDLLQIGKSFIRFDGTVQTAKTLPVPPLNIPMKVVERPIEKKQPTPIPDKQDDDLWREVEALAAGGEEVVAPASRQVTKTITKKAPVIVSRVDVTPLASITIPEKEENHDDLPYMHAGTHFEPRVYDLDEESPLTDIEKEKQKTPEDAHTGFLSWNLFFLAFVAIVLVATLIAGGVYVSMADKREVEKMAAAEGVADVAMALTYAQVNHIKPQKQNWSDAEFLKNNLSSLLSPDYPSFANLDNQGQFTNCPYILRIYTSSDLSHFIVIAQPEPSLLQWLLPKTSIAVDSQEMELRTIEDLKVLNRLLLSPTTLDGAGAREISSIIKQGELIPLSWLAVKQKNPEFSPPKAVALIRPGAENRIYNAPRYFHFGEAVLKKSLSLLESTGSGHEVTRVKQELDELARFSNFILYSSQGMQQAILGQKALSVLAPQHQFLAAYLNFNKEGELTSSHLLLDELYPAFADNSNEMQRFVSQNQENLTASLPIAELRPDNNHEHNHPLFLQLEILATTRQQALKPISDRITMLIASNTEKTIPHFDKRLDQLMAEYRDVDAHQQEKARENIFKLYQEYSHLPLAQFSSYVKAAGLELIAKNSLDKRAEDGKPHLSVEQITEQLQKIQQSNDFATLDKHVTETAGMLTLANLPNMEQLVRYQNEMRVLALQQVRRLIFSSDQSLPSAEFNEANRVDLSHILQASWVNDVEEYEYYLHEFDLRSVQS